MDHGDFEHGQDGHSEPAPGHHVIADIGIEVVKSEVVRDSAIGEDRWVRYTVREEDGREHCVATRIKPLVSDADFSAIENARRAAASTLTEVESEG